MGQRFKADKVVFRKIDGKYYAKPEEGRALAEFATAFKAHCSSMRLSIIKVDVDKKNNSICLSEKDYREYQKKAKGGEKKRSFIPLFFRALNFDIENSCYWLQELSAKNINEQLKSYKVNCKNLNLKEDLFKINSIENRIEISEDDYKTWLSMNQRNHVKNMLAYGIPFELDAQKSLYFIDP